MKIRLFGVLALLLAALPASAGDLVGKWTTEFDTQIGVQKYVFEFKKSGDTLTGEATFERSVGNGTAPLGNVKVEGDKVSFDEPLSMPDGRSPSSTPAPWPATSSSSSARSATSPPNS